MNNYNSYYSLLGLPHDAREPDIKAAFRKMALIHHPDKHDNSPESNEAFILLNQAYQTLSDPSLRTEYDRYLNTSTVLKDWKDRTLSAPALEDARTMQERSHEAMLQYLNFLLWDIEDILIARKKWGRGGIRQEKIMRRYLLAILTFLDKWVLTVGGHPDYFMDARKMKRIDPLDYRQEIGLKEQGHIPFVSIDDYFYNIRKRMDKFLSTVQISQLVDVMPGVRLSLLDCIQEVQRHTMHYLNYFTQVADGRLEEIPLFQYSHEIFKV